MTEQSLTPQPRRAVFDSSDEFLRRENWSKILSDAKRIGSLAKEAQRKNTSSFEAEEVLELARHIQDLSCALISSFPKRTRTSQELTTLSRRSATPPPNGLSSPPLVQFQQQQSALVGNLNSKKRHHNHQRSQSDTTSTTGSVPVSILGANLPNPASPLSLTALAYAAQQFPPAHLSPSLSLDDIASVAITQQNISQQQQQQQQSTRVIPIQRPPPVTIPQLVAPLPPLPPFPNLQQQSSSLSGCQMIQNPISRGSSTNDIQMDPQTPNSATSTTSTTTFQDQSPVLQQQIQQSPSPRKYSIDFISQ